MSLRPSISVPGHGSCNSLLHYRPRAMTTLSLTRQSNLESPSCPGRRSRGFPRGAAKPSRSSFPRSRPSCHLRQRSSLIPVLLIIRVRDSIFWGTMRFVTTPTATLLTGLSTVTLREWTSRRALIPADLPPKGKGSPARFTWQTILLLRVAVLLRDRFHFELQPHLSLFASLKTGLQHTSFIALWGKSLILRGGSGWSLVDDADGPPLAEDVVVIHLQPHLEALSAGFSLPHPSRSSGQLELFVARPIERPAIGVNVARPGNARETASASRRGLA